MNWTAGRTGPLRPLWLLVAGLLWMGGPPALWAQGQSPRPETSCGRITSLLCSHPILAQVPGPGAGGADPNTSALPPPPEEEVGGGLEIPWAALSGLTALFSLLGLIVFLVMKGEGASSLVKTKKRPGGVTVTDEQVDNYRLLNLMATGQTSQVWEVAEISSGRHFALKMLLPEHVRSMEQRHFLFHEAEVGRQIIHPKIIRMLTVIKDRDHPYVIMEFFPSTNLKLRIMHKEPYVRENFKTLVEQAAMALAFMHEKGWVHRDIKPDNILANSSAEVRLIDFALAQGISKRRGGLFSKRGRGKAQGTRSYMSPEQIRGEGLDARADIYSFGATMYELLTGRPPFRASNPTDLLTKHLQDKPDSPQIHNPDIGDELAKLILQMLAKRREERPKDFHEFLAKFRSLRLLFKSSVARRQTPR
jgi:eukaryotic-like serine/threonine-protein kinase